MGHRRLTELGLGRRTNGNEVTGWKSGQEEKNECSALNCVPKINDHLETQNVTLFGNRVISNYRCN